MARIEIQCPGCHARLRLPTGHAGSVRCPKCTHEFYADTRGDGDFAWRDRLLASLGGGGIAPAQHEPRKQRIGAFSQIVHNLPLALLWFFGVIGVLFAKLGFFSYYLVGLITICLVGGLPMGLLYVRARRRERQRTALSATQAIRQSTRRPILYLRSFQMDELMSRTPWWESFLIGVFQLNAMTAEERLVREFSKLGPVIAIGRPGEKMPGLGAARFYVTESHWQQKVADIARESQFVVWVSGSTQGLRWELRHLVSTISPPKLIIWPHPHLLRVNLQKREAAWRAFLDELGSDFIIPLPRRLGETRFFHFGAAFQPYAIEPNEYALMDAQNDALRTILYVKNLIGLPAWYWRSTRLAVRCAIGGAMGFVATLLSSAVEAAATEFSSHAADRGYYPVLPLVGFFFYSYAVELLSGAAFGVLFVLLQPRLAKTRWGYKGGIFLFLGALIFVSTVIGPAISVMRGGDWYIWRGEYVSLPNYLLMLFHILLLSDAAWLMALVVALRFLPYASGRSARPSV